MANYKGSGLMILRKLFEQRRPQGDDELIARLTGAESQLYRRMVATAWVPADLSGSVFAKAAEVLFPGDPKGLREIGRQLALDHLTGVYRILLKVATPAFVIGHAARLWQTYFDQGRAGVDRTSDDRTAVLKVEVFPELPEPHREIVAGFIIGALELSKARNVRVQLGGDAAMWRWAVSWL